MADGRRIPVAPHMLRQQTDLKSSFHIQIITESTGKINPADFRTRMLIDLGTNGEMAITDGIEMVVTATAAGPAFEGGAGAGIIGSDCLNAHTADMA